MIGSNAINRVSHAPSARVRQAYTVYARTRTRLSACACAGYAYSYTPAQMTERTYIHTYIPRIDPDLYCLALMRSAINNTCNRCFSIRITSFDKTVHNVHNFLVFWTQQCLVRYSCPRITVCVRTMEPPLKSNPVRRRIHVHVRLELYRSLLQGSIMEGLRKTCIHSPLSWRSRVQIPSKAAQLFF